MMLPFVSGRQGLKPVSKATLAKPDIDVDPSGEVGLSGSRGSEPRQPYHQADPVGTVSSSGHRSACEHRCLLPP